MPHPVPDPRLDPRHAAHYSPELYGWRRRHGPGQPQATETHADPQALTEILTGRPEHDRGGGQHEVCPGPPELGGRDAGETSPSVSVKSTVALNQCTRFE